MTMWFYQISASDWPLNKYRQEIWESERRHWGVGSKASAGIDPKPGDTVAFFYAPTGCKQPGFYGWAVILAWDPDDWLLYFRPVSPSDQLKMHPWWDNQARRLADKIRGAMKRRTLWPIESDLATELGNGINAWAAGVSVPMRRRGR